MNRQSTYQVVGFPDALAIALVLFFLGLTLARQYGGLKIGILEVPKLDRKPSKKERLFFSLASLLSFAAFIPIWPLQSAIERTDLSAAELCFGDANCFLVHKAGRQIGSPMEGYSLVEQTGDSLTLWGDAKSCSSYEFGSEHTALTQRMSVRLVRVQDGRDLTRSDLFDCFERNLAGSCTTESLPNGANVTHLTCMEGSHREVYFVLGFN